MGLHPQAIVVVMMLVLDLLWRGYKVVISTHSPLILDVVWAIRRLAEHNAHWTLLCQAFALTRSADVREVLEYALKCSYKVYFLDLDPRTRGVSTRDISNLDPDAADKSEADWGGLTGFSSRFGEAVRAAVNDAEAS